MGFTYLQYLQPNTRLQFSQNIWDLRIYVFTSQKFEKKSKRIDMKGLNIYIKDITKQVFLKDLGFTYLQYLHPN